MTEREELKPMTKKQYKDFCRDRDAKLYAERLAAYRASLRMEQEG